MDLADLPQPTAQACRSVPVRSLRAGQWVDGQDSVVEEVPVALEYNGISHAVMMATPTDLEDFACGFSVTEGIVNSVAQIHDMEWLPSAQGHTLRLTIAASCFAGLKERRRNLTGRTGCGLCGTESLDQAVRLPAPLAKPHTFSAAAVARAMAGMREQQVLLAATGASHAAAWCNATGEIVLLREDVGRHNALDKLVGALLRAVQPVDSGFIVVTSRASYEMVQKTATAGVSLLAAVSGVTALAVQVAQEAGVTLLGFTRGQDASVYSHPERFILDSSTSDA